MGTLILLVETGNASAGSRRRTVIAFPSSYRPTLILIISGTAGVVTGHFEDKTIVAYCRSEAAIARLFIRVQYRVRSASGCPCRRPCGRIVVPRAHGANGRGCSSSQRPQATSSGFTRLFEIAFQPI